MRHELHPDHVVTTFEEVPDVWFHCLGCGYAHSIRDQERYDGPLDKWRWNQDRVQPVFEPSVLCNKDYPNSRCHSYVGMGRARPGQIEYLSDCWHALKGQVVDLPKWLGRMG